jgi:hypothetical protein
MPTFVSIKLESFFFLKNFLFFKKNIMDYILLKNWKV